MSIKEKIQQGLRQFGLTSLAVDNATTVFFLTAMIIIYGLKSYESTPKESFPEISFPSIFVNTLYFGNSAEDIENLVTRPLEKELASISEIKTLKSSSLQDFSLIEAEFESDVDMDWALRKVKDAVDKAKSDLPNDLTEDPDVIDIDLSELPIMSINLSGDYSNDELRGFAEYIEDKLEALEEVTQVNVKGTREREVNVDVDLFKMESMQVSFGDIENAIKSENLTMSGGEVIANNFRRNVRVVGEFKTVGELQDMIVKSEHEAPIYLRDIADVSFGFKDKTSIARSNQNPVVSLDVIKKSGTNLLDASDKIKKIVEASIGAGLPEGLSYQFFNDQSIQIRNTVSNLENGIISGVILVVLVLLFFLGLRNAMFVGIAIPLSMLLGIAILSNMGITMNMVVLFALILALGMLVDNAIVVVENIYRYMQEGYSGMEAAKYGTGEVAVPIIASTATTLAAFIPLAFWPGLMGSFMKYLPITLIVVLSSSLFVALVINPVVTSTLMKEDEQASDRATYIRKRKGILLGAVLMFLGAILAHFSGTFWLRNILGVVIIVSLVNFFLLRPVAFVFQDRFLPFLERTYEWFIDFALHRFMPIVVFAGTFVLLILSMILFATNMPKVELFPKADPQYANAFIELPLGTDIDATNQLMQQIEVEVTEAMKPYNSIVDAILAQIGEHTGDPNAGPDFGTSPNKGRLTVSFVPSEDRNGISSVKALETLREVVKGHPGAEIVVEQNQDGPPTGKAINIEVKGEDITTLSQESEKILAYLNSKNIPGIEELKMDVRIGKPELLVDVDREAARRYQISTYSIANTLRTALFGKEVSKFKLGEDEYPIQLRGAEDYRHDLGKLMNQKVTFRNPANGRISQVPISTVAATRYSSTYNSIKRIDQKRVITIASNVLSGYNANEIVAELTAQMERYQLPNGISYEFTGEQQKQAEEMSFLGGALMTALFLIFLILVAQFNSLISPFIILLSVVFSTIGVFLGYATSGMDIGIIMTGVGIISLAGIVVNNAIVLVDYVNLLLERKILEKGDGASLTNAEVKAAIIQGGATRLRPVLLTAITTVLGLVPLAIGFNFDFFSFIEKLDPNYFVGGDNAAIWGPMSWTVIYGLVFATFLTLIVVPVMYWLAYRLKMTVIGIFSSEKV